MYERKTPYHNLPLALRRKAGTLPPKDREWYENAIMKRWGYGVRLRTKWVPWRRVDERQIDAAIALQNFLSMYGR